MTALLARDPSAPLVPGELAPLNSITGRRTNRVEWLLPVATLALAGIGAVLIWAATKPQLVAAGGNPQADLYRQLLNIGIGIGLVVVAARVDLRLLRVIGPALYLGSILGLLAVLVIGSTINGARAWIVLGGGFELEPAEFMKLGLIVGMAAMFAHRSIGRPPDARPTRLDVIFALLMAAVPLGLVLLQPDLGSALVLCAATFGVLVAAGVRARWTVGLLLLGGIGFVVAAKSGLLAGYQLDRFRAFINPHADTQGVAYNITQVHIAMANGHLFGTGLFNGPQTNGVFVPEQQTDFVFSVAGEEFGFAGCVVIVALFGLLCWRGLRIAAASRGAGRIIACGVVCWFALQAFQNIGLTPVTGLPLPFLSYGGSSMFAQCLGIGLLLAVHRHSRSPS
jgi:rod shape determining protein RodA